MTSFRLPLLAGCALTVLASAARSDRANTAGVAQLRWMTGCWEERKGDRLVEEQWMAPRAGGMMGMGRTHRGDALREWEFLRITDEGGHTVYHAQPSGQTPADFVAATTSDTMVVFANPAHDFPQRVIYRTVGSDSLFARVEGTTGGTSRGFDFRYARVACR